MGIINEALGLVLLCGAIAIIDEDDKRKNKKISELEIDNKILKSEKSDSSEIEILKLRLKILELESDKAK